MGKKYSDFYLSKSLEISETFYRIRILMKFIKKIILKKL
ncbi:MAG: hypothetical protein HEEMFOPI_01492 [Holosporales bacterium]